MSYSIDPEQLDNIILQLRDANRAMLAKESHMVFYVDSEQMQAFSDAFMKKMQDACVWLNKGESIGVSCGKERIIKYQIPGVGLIELKPTK